MFRLPREQKNLDELYRLGHFLKGSSATVGLTKVKDSCEKIQRYGKKENVDGTPEPNADLCLSRIKSTLVRVKAEYKEAEQALKKFYDDKV
jgi:osomolarity two-component system, phosphorelay intermediate protein YPD1